MDYAIEHEGKAFTPNGRSDIPDVNAYNRKVESEELAYIKTAPEKLFLYVKQHIAPSTRPILSMGQYSIITFMGTPVSDTCQIGPRAHIGFGYHTYRRSVDAIIHGVRYVGWYMESSGDYCRLRKAKRQ